MKSLQILMMNKAQGGQIAEYGYLYNWYAYNTATFVPNSDWKVPTQIELETLFTYLGGQSVSGGKLKETGTAHWTTPNTGADNSSGFTGMGAGYRDYSTGVFTGFNQILTCGVFEYDYIPKVAEYNSIISESTWETNWHGLSIRLLWDGTGDAPSTITDYDGNVYDTIVIGTQTWLIQSWACTHLNDGTALTKVTDNTAWAALETEGYCSPNGDDNNVFE